jgi:hypothetical protein
MDCVDTSVVDLNVIASTYLPCARRSIRITKEKR